MVFKIGILISGNGSNMLNIINACQTNFLSSEVKLVISSNSKAQGIKKARRKKINTLTIEEKKFHTKNHFEEEILKSLIKHDVNLLCLAGYMKILSKEFLKKWKYDILNIHPSLLPAFKGIDAPKQALDLGVKFSGCTVHYVNEDVDCGKIIDQRSVKVDKKESLTSLKKKILKEEHKLYINVIGKLEKEV